MTDARVCAGKSGRIRRVLNPCWLRTETKLAHSSDESVPSDSVSISTRYNEIVENKGAPEESRLANKLKPFIERRSVAASARRRRRRNTCARLLKTWIELILSTSVWRRVCAEQKWLLKWRPGIFSLTLRQVLQDSSAKRHVSSHFVVLHKENVFRSKEFVSFTSH